MAGMVNIGQARLIVQGGPNSGMTIPLLEGPITLGRRSDNDAVVDESTVSRRHALIMKTVAGFILRDLNTSNGTFVNRERIGQGEYLLRHGDRICLAGSQANFVFRQEGPNTAKISTGSSQVGEAAPGTPEDQERPKQQQREPPLFGKDSELLRLLESRKGTVVSRAEIASLLWPELLEDGLADQVIDQSIGRLRAHVEGDPLRPMHVITAGEIGFLLV